MTTPDDKLPDVFVKIIEGEACGIAEHDKGMPYDGCVGVSSGGFSDGEMSIEASKPPH